VPGSLDSRCYEAPPIPDPHDRNPSDGRILTIRIVVSGTGVVDIDAIAVLR
jgi:hypothetical protein